MRKLQLEELGRVDVDTFKSKPKHPVVLVLDNLRSAHNVGAAFRTGDAFALEALYLCGITPQPPHKEIHKSALGATESVEWYYFEQTTEALKHLKERGYRIVGVEQTDTPTYLQDFRPLKAEKYAFVFGNEVYGLSDEVLPFLDMALEIPQFGTKHSLNVSVTIGIVCWHYWQQVFGSKMP
ncbi:tRNA G18 (ribose-2'-O)-methylase SpoU [Thermonema lapsum]|uniref:tRNA G18 (Ribose-2'-O)-methylase SpoU n=1 Tax=Thermonema lapsum TaxID=28195 RepID=A0A846MTU3_9BACT|nr:RNA methyltransferase [Thermonema lapsum]NIK74720.1 tRNA G18 (ribose-2'-O)-methylase SpoU [Thermonema lapsum]